MENKIKRLPKNYINKRFAELLITDPENVIHKVNDVIVNSYQGIYRLVNTITFNIIEFDNEEDCMNYILDNFSKTKINKTLELWQN